MVEEEESKPSECTNYALLFRFVSQRTPSCAEFALVVLGSLGPWWWGGLYCCIANAYCQRTRTHTHSVAVEDMEDMEDMVEAVEARTWLKQAFRMHFYSGSFSQRTSS